MVADTRVSGDSSPADSPQFVITSLSYLPLFALHLQTHPAVHSPCALRSVTATTICRLMDEASELAVYCLIGDVLGCVGIDPCGRGGSPEIHSSPLGSRPVTGRGPSRESVWRKELRNFCDPDPPACVRLRCRTSPRHRANEIASGVIVIQRNSVSRDIAGCILKVGVVTLSWTSSLLISLAFRDLIDVDVKYVYFFHEEIPSRFVFLLIFRMGPIHLGRAGNSPSPLRLVFSTNPLRLIPNDSSFRRRHFSLMGILPRSGTSLPGPVASYSVHRNMGAKWREQRKLKKKKKRRF